MNRYIEFVEKEIDLLEMKKESAFRHEYYSVYEEYSQKITALQQIKCVLEAWEVVKRYTDTSEDIVNTEYYFIKGLDDEFETLKKALEVEDDTKERIN